jgi:proline dehydrogenase
MNSNLRRFATTPLHWLYRKAAGAYVAGPELRDALSTAQTLAFSGAASTICFWDGHEDTPPRVAEMYLDILQSLGSRALDSYLSIKAPSIAFDSQLLAKILDEARRHRIRVHFDSLGWELATCTREFIEQACAQYPRIGCTLPARWRRSLRDAEWSTSLGLSVRVIKGQWPDPNSDPTGLRQAFLDVISALAGRKPKVAVATHDPTLAAAAIRRLQDARTPCELELLYGLPSRAVQRIARDLNVPVRYYVPYGHAWLPYAFRQVKRNPRILWWLFRDTLLAGNRTPQTKLSTAQ